MVVREAIGEEREQKSVVSNLRERKWHFVGLNEGNLGVRAREAEDLCAISARVRCYAKREPAGSGQRQRRSL